MTNGAPFACSHTGCDGGWNTERFRAQSNLANHTPNFNHDALDRFCAKVPKQYAAFFWVAFLSAFLSVVAGTALCFRHKASSWRIQRYIMAGFSLTSSIFCIAMIRTALNGKKDFSDCCEGRLNEELGDDNWFQKMHYNWSVKIGLPINAVLGFISFVFVLADLRWGVDLGCEITARAPEGADQTQVDEAIERSTERGDTTLKMTLLNAIIFTIGAISFAIMTSIAGLSAAVWMWETLGWGLPVAIVCLVFVLAAFVWPLMGAWCERPGY